MDIGKGRYRITVTAEASDSCVLDGSTSSGLNLSWHWGLANAYFEQISFTKWTYKSNGNCPCKLTDFREDIVPLDFYRGF